MKSFHVSAGQGNNKQVCVTVHALIPADNSLIVQIRLPGKKRRETLQIYFGCINSHIHDWTELWRLAIIQMHKYMNT